MFHVSLYFSIYCLYIFLNAEESNLIFKSLPFYELVYNVNISTFIQRLRTVKWAIGSLENGEYRDVAGCWALKKIRDFPLLSLSPQYLLLLLLLFCICLLLQNVLVRSRVVLVVRLREGATCTLWSGYKGFAKCHRPLWDFTGVRERTCFKQMKNKGFLCERCFLI